MDQYYYNCRFYLGYFEIFELNYTLIWNLSVNNISRNEFSRFLSSIRKNNTRSRNILVKFDSWKHEFWLAWDLGVVLLLRSKIRFSLMPIWWSSPNGTPANRLWNWFFRICRFLDWISIFLFYKKYRQWNWFFQISRFLDRMLIFFI